MKTAKIESPHATLVNNHGWEFRVLKTYQRPDKEATNAYARWFMAVKSPFTFGSFDMGDTYVKDVLSDGARCVQFTAEFAALYPALVGVK